MDDNNKIIYLPDNTKIVVYPKKEEVEECNTADDKILCYVFASNLMLCMTAALGALINYCFGFKQTALYCIFLCLWCGLVSFVSAKVDDYVNTDKERRIANLTALCVVVFTVVVIFVTFPCESIILKTGLE